MVMRKSLNCSKTLHLRLLPSDPWAASVPAHALLREEALSRPSACVACRGAEAAAGRCSLIEIHNFFTFGVQSNKKFTFGVQGEKKALHAGVRLFTFGLLAGVRLFTFGLHAC